MTAPPVPDRKPQARRHSVATMALAQTMYGDGDAWNANEIAAYLTSHGTTVAPNTVRRWVDPGYAKRHNAARAKGRRVPAGPTPKRETDRERAIRLGLQMRSRGITYHSISVALEVCEGLRWSGDGLRKILRDAGAAPDHRRGRTFKAA